MFSYLNVQIAPSCYIKVKKEVNKKYSKSFLLWRRFYLKNNLTPRVQKLNEHEKVCRLYCTDDVWLNSYRVFIAV